jgi:hypothetical protein
MKRLATQEIVAELRSGCTTLALTIPSRRGARPAALTYMLFAASVGNLSGCRTCPEARQVQPVLKDGPPRCATRIASPEAERIRR